jgi:hypothetical protein
MIPRSCSRRLILAFLLTFIALASVPQTEKAFAVPPAMAGITKAYCATDTSGPVVYFSHIFDAVMQARTKISTLPLDSAFRIYLIEEYDFAGNGNFPTHCGVFETLSQAETNKRQLMSQAQQAGKRVVEVNWNPGPLVETPQPDESVTIGPKGPPPTHTFCALGHESTMYFSAVFDTAGGRVDPKWNDSFNEFLRKTYSAEGEAQCVTLNTVREAEYNLKARIGGVRANNHKAVETGWRFGALPLAVATGTSTQKTPLKVVDDDEPPPAPPKPMPPPTASAMLQARDFAAKEGPQVLAYCQKDPMLSKIFDCYRVQRSVYNYRMEHGTSDSLASLFTEEKVNLAEAIGTGLGLWVRARATADKFDNKVTNCIEQKFNVSFYDKPYVSKMNDIYATSVAACKP